MDLRAFNPHEYEKVISGMPSVCMLCICTCPSPTPERLDLSSYAVFKSFSFLDFCPVNVNIQLRRIGTLHWSSETQKGDFI
jgi:hypothetical protein